MVEELGWYKFASRLLTSEVNIFISCFLIYCSDFTSYVSRNSEIQNLLSSTSGRTTLVVPVNLAVSLLKNPPNPEDKMIDQIRDNRERLRDVSMKGGGVGMSSIVDKSTFSLCQLNRIEWLGIESK